MNPKSVLRKREGVHRINLVECNDIRGLLQTLITTEGSFPELEWLDIELQSEDAFDYDLIDKETLRLMPDALPALHKLCLSNCFKKGSEEISPHQLRQFFTNLHTPLTSLSLCGSKWMTDAHIEVMMPIIGENLVRLEVVDCKLWHESDDDPEAFLSDGSLVSIAKHCKHLKSFSMVSSHITCHGLEMVLSANTGITTLDLSASDRLGPRAVDIISRYLPRLKELRNWWQSHHSLDWLNDDGLIALVDAQEKESGGSGIFLDLVGFHKYLVRDGPQLTIRGLKYAIEKGVKEIEVDEGNFQRSIADLGLDVKLYHAPYVFYMDGSQYKRVLHW